MNYSTISVIDTSTDTLTDTIPLPSGSKPNAICLNSVSPHAYTLNSGDNSISIIDTTKKTVVSTVKDSRFTGLTTIACDPTGTRVLIGNNDSSGTASNILYLNTSTLALDSLETAVGINPGSIVFNKIGSKAYVLSQGIPSISVLDTTAMLITGSPLTLSESAYPWSMAIHTNDTYLYVINLLGSVTFINPATMEVLPSPQTVDYPSSISVSNKTNTLYVSDISGTVSLINPVSQSIISSFFSESPPIAIVERNDGQRVYVASESDIISSYDTSSLATTPITIALPKFSSPRGLTTLQGIRHNLDLNITGSGSGLVHWPFNTAFPQNTSGTVGVPEGIAVTINAVADACSTTTWNICDSPSGGASASASCTVSPFSSPKVVNVEFSKKAEHSISTSIIGGGGSISCPTPVCDGGNTVCTITPASGYDLSSLKDNGTDIMASVAGGATFQIQNIVGVHAIEAKFARKPVAVTATSSSNGTVLPNTVQTVDYGNDVTFTFTPNTGFSLTSVTGCGGILSGNTFTTAAVTTDCSVAATYTLAQHQVTASAQTGGTISPAVLKIDHGSTASFVITPNTANGYINVSGCGGTLSGNQYTTAVITADCSVSAVFENNQLGLTTSSNWGGIISGPSFILSGGKAVFTVTPTTASGYKIESVTGCGGTLSDNIYTTDVITVGCNVAATFVLNQYQVTTSAGTGGSISSGTNVVHGSTVSFTVIPDIANGFKIASVTGCGGTLTGNTYTTAAATSPCSIAATFSLNQYLVTPSAGTGGVITPDVRIVSYGSTTTFLVTPLSGHYIGSVDGCSGTLSGNTYTTGSITGDCSVSATFVALPSATALTLDSNGSISCPKPTVAGDTVTCLTTPGKGYHLATLTDNGVSVLASVTNKNSYSINNISSFHNISASFTAYTLNDALQALRYAVKIATPKPEEYLWLDVAPLEADKPKGNGIIDIMDALVLLKQSIGSYTAW